MRKSHIRPTPLEMLDMAPLSTAIQQPKSPHSKVSKYLVLVGSLFVLALLGLHQSVKSIQVSEKGIESHAVALAVESNATTTIDELDTWSSFEDAGPAVHIVDTITVTPTIETWPHKESFYTSSYPESDTSSTIIFNVFKGSPKALEMQLKAAISQRNVVPPQIWVMCFNSPQQDAFYQVVTTFQSNPRVLQAGIKIQWTASDFNHKFHGRFLLGYMATTKYVLIVDDDKNIDDTTVADYIQYMHQKPGVWGNFGHIRAPTFKGYKSWPNVGFPKKDGIPLEPYAEVDYLSGMWFVQQTWLEYFMKERPPTWETSEDMHLSHVLRKYLNLNTYGGNVALQTEELPGKTYAATVGSALDLREYVFDHQLGRGNKVAAVDQLVDTLVYVETVDDIQQFILLLESCKGRENVDEWCDVGRTSAVFRGAKEQDVEGLIQNAIQLCTLTNCKYLSVKPKIQHYIQYFNMREGFGQHDTSVEIPWQTAASDVLQSFVGILTNVQPRKIFVRDITHRQWIENKSNCIKKRRLSLYDQTIRLGLQIYVTSPTNPKWKDHEEEAAFPTNFYAYQWSKGEENMLTVIE